MFHLAFWNKICLIWDYVNKHFFTFRFDEFSVIYIILEIIMIY